MYSLANVERGRREEGRRKKEDGRWNKGAGRLLWILLNNDFNFHLRSSHLPAN
ncbi:hypothetical protein [Chryseobacterium mucoviscidosis]|uniref:hypothetical protein n=1 Tax=Chryseobacterium mucoviscidosis TaxID=1945581 RepID=UPI0031E0A151